MAIIIGGPANESLVGDPLGVPENDIIFGNGGHDDLVGLNGNDLLFGGAGQDNLNGSAGNDTLEGGVGGDILDGGVGIDWLSYAQSSAGVLVDFIGLAVGGGDAAGDSVVFASFENIAGSGFADRLVGDKRANQIVGGAGDDYLNGAGGKDTLRGDAGQDFLLGGGSKDTFVFFEITDSAAAAPDTIGDFVSGTDRIDLQGIDATIVPLTFIGHNVAFSGVAGEFRTGDNGTDAVVQIDEDGDALADLTIIVLGVTSFAAGDFIV